MVQKPMSLFALILSVKTLSITFGSYDPDDSWNIFQLVVDIFSSHSTTLEPRLLPNLEALKFTGRLHLVYPGNYTDLCIYPLPPADITIHGPLYLLNFNLYPRTRILKTLASYFLSLAEQSGVRVNV
jgi:hypothetical protein